MLLFPFQFLLFCIEQYRLKFCEGYKYYGTEHGDGERFPLGKMTENRKSDREM